MPVRRAGQPDHIMQPLTSNSQAEDDDDDDVGRNSTTMTMTMMMMMLSSMRSRPPILINEHSWAEADHQRKLVSNSTPMTNQTPEQTNASSQTWIQSAPSPPFQNHMTHHRFFDLTSRFARSISKSGRWILLSVV